MKKIFSKEIFLIIPLFLFTLFVSVNKVNADLSFYFYTYQTDFMLTNLDTMKQTTLNYINSQSDLSNDYILSCSVNRNTQVMTYCWAYILYSNKSRNDIYAFLYNGSQLRYVVSNSAIKTMRFTSPSELTSFDGYTTNPEYITGLYYDRAIFYSTFDVNYQNTTNNLNFYYNYPAEYTFTQNINTSSTFKFYTVLELYEDYRGPINPPPLPDNYPLLTSFYTLCIDKFSIIAEEFTTNYIYLAIITIFLIITIIYILKRRFS